MKVFGLQAAIYHGPRLASHLPPPPTRQIVALHQHALARWHAARRDGLTAEQAANLDKGGISRCHPSQTTGHTGPYHGGRLIQQPPASPWKADETLEAGIGEAAMRGA